MERTPHTGEREMTNAQTIYDLVHIDSCEVVERFSELGLAVEECKAMNRRHDEPQYCVCKEGGLPI